MPVLDMKTVLISYIITNLIVTAIMGLVWRQNRRRFAGTHLWAASFTCHTTGMLLLLLRGLVPDLVSVMLGNTLLISGNIFFFFGLGRFLGCPTPPGRNVLILLAALSLVFYYNYLQPNTAARIIVFSLASLLIFMQSVWLALRRARLELRRPARWVGIIQALFALIQIYRITVAIFKPSPGGFFQVSTLDLLGLIGNQMLTILLTFSLILMLSGRLLLEVRAQEERQRTFLGNFQGVAYQALIPSFLPLMLEGRVEEITGRPARDFLEGRTTWEQVIHPEDLSSVLVSRRQVVETPGYVQQLEYRMTHPDGRVRWVYDVGQGGDLSGERVIRGALYDITERKQAEEALKLSEEKFFKAFHSSPDGILITRLSDGRVTEVNEGFSALSGYSREEALSSSTLALSLWADPQDRERCLSVLRENTRVQDLEFRFRTRAGQILECRFSGEIINIGNQPHTLAIVRDITERKRNERLLQARMRLMEYAGAHSLEALLQKTLDEAEILTDSRIGFYHFLEADQQTLSLQAWSTRTLRDFCTARGQGRHYPVSEAGVWADCVNEGRPVIHNDYAALPHRRGLPEGHAPVTRELVVPIFREDRIVALLGVGNKASDYNDRDVEMMDYLADVAWEITDRKRTEEELERTRAILQAAIEQTPAGLLIADAPDVRIRTANSAALGIRNDLTEPLTEIPLELHPRNWQTFWPDGTPVRAEDLPLSRAIQRGETSRNVEVIIRRPDGEKRWVLANAAPIRNARGEIIAGVVVFPDITEHKRAEEERLKLEREIQQVQKLESLGVLAGGIAHDFNNLLMAILGHADLALMDLPPLAPVRSNLEQIIQASRRAADLCRQMLAYSGRGKFVVEAIELGALITEMVHLLKTSISKKAILNLNLGKNLPPLEGDATQIRQVLMNLITNASEAIGEGSGVITLSTKMVEGAREYLQEAAPGEELPEGPYIYLEVSDTGCGMDPETKARIFEPFFTTKFTGRGLGLAAVLGIVRGHHGVIQIDSQTGQGTTFRVLFPALEEARAPAESRPETDGTPWRGKGCVLLVDDEEAMRAVGKTMLERMGFQALTAADGREAVRIYQDQCRRIDLVLMDLTMPHMGGEEALRQLRRINPEVRVILASGFSEQEMAFRITGEGPAGFLQKPFSMQDLTAKVREVMGA